MIKIIISVIIGIFIYNMLKKGIKLVYDLYRIKKNTKNLHKIINNVVENKDINNLFDTDFWGNK